MTFSTHEMYDEHEYYLKFKRIHPILHYSNNPLDIKKKDFQIYLLNEFEIGNITNDQFIEKYNIYTKTELQYKILLNTIEYEHKKILKDIKKNNEDILINYINTLIK
jgi:hypothetical protein